VDEAVRSASAAELWKLADAARFAGRPDVATAALSALRSRHGARGSTAFLLGKIAADHAARPRRPSLVRHLPGRGAERTAAEEALGRLMTLQRRSDSAAAAAAAKKYLARYQAGHTRGSRGASDPTEHP
jgi:hypothetical protein